MNRHLLAVVVTLLITAASPTAQDVEFIRALERAQQARPATLTSTSRIAPPAEPGAPLVIHGRVFAADRRTPIANAIVFAYHTDREGHYDKPGTGGHSWRLKGWARTDAEGQFEFRTIRPGAYPGRTVAEHVHFTVFTPSGERYHAGELNFEDDTLVSASERAASQREGSFGGVRPVRIEGGVQHVDHRIQIDPKQRFAP